MQRLLSAFRKPESALRPLTRAPAETRTLALPSDGLAPTSLTSLLFFLALPETEQPQKAPSAPPTQTHWPTHSTEPDLPALERRRASCCRPPPPSPPNQSL